MWVFHLVYSTISTPILEIAQFLDRNHCAQKPDSVPGANPLKSVLPEEPHFGGKTYKSSGRTTFFNLLKMQVFPEDLQTPKSSGKLASLWEELHFNGLENVVLPEDL